MNSIIDFYECKFNELDARYVHSKSNNDIALQAGITGEDSVYRIIRRFVSKVYIDVVIWDKKHKFTTEADFVFMINGYLVLVEAKEWYGVLKNHEDIGKIYCIQNNIKGQTFTQVRSNPVSMIGGFAKDLRLFLKPNAPSKNLQMRRYVVYTRDDLDFSQVTTSSSVISCNLNGFEKHFESLLNEKNETPYELQKELPSWDYYYDSIDDNWFKVALLGSNIETDSGTIPLELIDIIVFYDEDKAYIKTNDGKIIESIIHRNSIRFNSKMGYAKNRVKCIKLNRLLHQTSMESLCTD